MRGLLSPSWAFVHMLVLTERQGGTTLDSSGYTATALFEHRFWLQILGDHARFIYNSLSPKETVEIEKARQFITVFDQLLAQSRQDPSRVDLTSLTRQANLSAQNIRAFKLHLLRRHLAGKISIGLSPTFLNHMVNEVDEYLRILCYLLVGTVPPKMNPIHHHLLWLQDAYGHSSAIDARLDFVEANLKEKSAKFTKHFEDYYLKAVELAGYLRTHLSKFPALSRFNRQAELEIALFQSFLREIEEMELTHEVLGMLAPLMPDHMYREECYYLTKLAKVSAAKMPACDPTKPRVE